MIGTVSGVGFFLAADLETIWQHPTLVDRDVW
jgi:hypothetical protein